MRPGSLFLATMTVLHGGGLVALADPAVGAPATTAPGPASVTAPTVSEGSVEIAIRRMADGLAAGFDRLPGNAR
jgi:hypothetical protein